MAIPTLGNRVPQHRGRLRRRLAAALLRLLGWRLEGTIPNVPKFVAIGAPHTSAWDWIIAMLAIPALGVRVTWMGAEWIFRYPFMGFLGGVEVDRSRPQGVVERYIEQFANHDQYILGLLPEGTRKKMVPWKSGFWRIAHGAGVPILVVTIDLRQKRLVFGPTIEPSDDYEADLAKIQSLFTEFLDQYPDRFGM